MIDCHVHVGGVPEHFTNEFALEMMSSCDKDEKEMSVHPKTLLAEMKENGVERAFILAFNAKRTLNIDVTNQYVSELCSRYPKQFIGFASFDGASLPNARVLRSKMDCMGLSGYKIASAYLDLSPSDPAWYPLYADASQNNLPVLIHMGYTPIKKARIKYCHPSHLKPVLKRFPDLKLIIAHMAWPWVQQTIQILSEYQNVYADLSIVAVYQPLEKVADIICEAKKNGVVEKILWGSDYPMSSLKECKGRIIQLKDHMEDADRKLLTDAEWAQILYLNAIKLISVKV
ncbi:amidohydrolase family protein [Bacillus halotolerans]|uniref:amidohydrolase family protein n=1 Tax=Bacillus halotolerans TaxID=260554 RepID=UPI00403F66C8